MSNPDPAVTNLPLTFGGLGTYNATVTTWEMVSVVTAAAQGFAFGTGRWLVTLIVAGLGGNPPAPVVSQQDVTLASPGTITVPAVTFRHLRDFTNARSVQVSLSACRRSGSLWVPYAATALGPGNVTLPAAAVPAANALPVFGATNDQVTGTVAAFSVFPQGYLDLTNVALKNLGMTLTRTDPQWMHLCPSSRTFDTTVQAQYDAYFTSIAAQGLKAVVYLCPIISSPAWAATGGTRGNPPASWTDYANFVSDFLTRWGANVAAVEMVNEPNINAAPNGGGQTTAANYVSYLAHCYTAVKAYSSSMPVLAGCLSTADNSYLAALYATGTFRGNYDAISAHAYGIDFSTSPFTSHDPATAAPDALVQYSIVAGLERLHETMRANGDGLVPIWVTECGWQTGNTGTAGAFSQYDVSEAQQAAYLTFTARALARLSYVAAVLFYAGRDPSTDRTGPYTYGLLDYWGNRPKPAVAALTATLASLTAGTG